MECLYHTLHPKEGTEIYPEEKAERLQEPEDMDDFK